MKKLVYFLMAAFCICMISCACQSGHESDQTPPGVTEDVKVFTSAEEVQEYHNWCINAQKVDSVFNAMTPEEIGKVATVLLHQKNSFTVDDIVLEYLKNKSIYQVLQLSAYESNHDTIPRTRSGVD